MRKPPAFLAATVTLAASLGAATAASATDSGDRSDVSPGSQETIADGLFTPLSLAVNDQGDSFVSQDFGGILSKVDRDGELSHIAAAPGFGLSAVSTRGDTVYFSQTASDHSSATLMSVSSDGGASELVADLYENESTANPDRVNTYGFVDLPEDCASQVPFPAEYSGLVDTNPYGSLALDDDIYVADAGANAILRVEDNGTVSTLAVLPASDPIVITAEFVAMVGFPACTVGYGYRFEPVPTDVELGPDGWLYVTSLPGGPEGPALGARGAVYKVHPQSGEIDRVATGFVGATGLAVSEETGNIWVAELFGGPNGSGQVSLLRSDESIPEPFLSLSSPAAIELRGDELYVTSDAFVLDVTGAPQSIGKITVVAVTR